MKINEITEPKVKTKTGFKSTLDTGEIPNARNDLPDINRDSPKTGKGKDSTSFNPKKASAASTKSKTAAINMPNQAGDLMRNFDFDEPDIIPNSTPNDVSTEVKDSMPALISRELQAAGQVEPEFHEVKNLPGYLSSGIRKMGRAVFAPFTNTPIEDILVLADLGGQGPNSKREINSVAGYLQNYGDRITDAELYFHEKIPGYNVDLKIYKAMGNTFMLVMDFAGSYIYSWPSTDDVESAFSRGDSRLSNDKKRLK